MDFCYITWTMLVNRGEYSFEKTIKDKWNWWPLTQADLYAKDTISVFCSTFSTLAFNVKISALLNQI